MRIEQQHCVLLIEDNGRGTMLDRRRKEGFGLLGMQERVRQLEGDLTFDSAPDDGFRIGIRLPLEVIEEVSG